MNFGDWELKSWNDINTKDLEKWMTNYLTEKCPNGEGYEDVSIRVRHFFNNLMLNHPNDETIAIVTHSGLIKVALPYLDHSYSKETAMSRKIDFGEVLNFELNFNLL